VLWNRICVTKIFIFYARPYSTCPSRAIQFDRIKCLVKKKNGNKRINLSHINFGVKELLSRASGFSRDKFPTLGLLRIKNFQQNILNQLNLNRFLVRPEGFEPPTTWFEARLGVFK
jgi:hypothetical protein